MEHIIGLYSIEFCANRPFSSSDTIPLPSSSSSLVSSLLNKHIQIDQSTSTLADEITRFQNVGYSDDNVLNFWKKNEPDFPKLATIAKVILAVPMTTSKSESSFSTAGCLLRKQRSSITPFRAEKTLFVHDNYNLLQMQ